MRSDQFAGHSAGPADTVVWQPDLANRQRPVYLAIADAIADDIRSGRLGTGQRLPPQRALADRLGVDLTTVSRAYSEARQRGLLDARVGQGTFVRSQEGRVQEGRAQEDAREMRPEPPKPAPVERPAGRGAFIDMTMNQPPLPDDPALLARLRQGLAESALGLDPRALLRYPEIGAGEEDRAAGARWLGRRLPDLAPGLAQDEASERVVVAPGTQGALLALLGMLAEPGDAVCAEALTYPGFKAIARQLRLRVVGVAMDRHGLDPDALRAAFEAHAPKALYCTPTLHNPTTATLPLERRHAIAAIAREHGVTIVEDDIYGVLPPDAPPAIGALAPDVTFCVAGLAKCVAPGLRIAYVAAPDARQAMRLAAAQRATTLGTAPLAAAAATRWIGDGTAEALLAAIRAEAAVRQTLARGILPADAMAAHPNGFHLWLSLPADWTRGEFATHLRAQGIVAVVSDSFATMLGAPDGVRICLGAPVSRADCQRMLRVLATALEQPPDLAGIVI